VGRVVAGDSFSESVVRLTRIGSVQLHAHPAGVRSSAGALTPAVGVRAAAVAVAGDDGQP
jgi:hypothetical protein